MCFDKSIAVFFLTNCKCVISKTNTRFVVPVLAAVFSVFLFSNATASAVLPVPDFRAKVLKISNYGLVHFEGNGAYRLWGILPDVNYLRELIIGHELDCFRSGEVVGRWRGNSIRSRSVVCTARIQSPDQQFFDLITHLLETGNAIELCSETLGLLGTCSATNIEQ